MELLYLMMKKWQKYSINIFETFAKNLSLPENPSIKEPSVELFTDTAILALEKLKDHPSITFMKNKMTTRIIQNLASFCFSK